jgi:large subunit ribosomal protein L23
MIRRAIESLWNVKVEKVATITIRGYGKRFGKHSFVTSSIKKAVVTLRKGYTIDMPWQYESIKEEDPTSSINSDKR